MASFGSNMLYSLIKLTLFQGEIEPMAVAIVTGASRGIGLEISKRLVTQGYTTFGLARNFENCAILDLQHNAISDHFDHTS